MLAPALRFADKLLFPPGWRLADTVNRSGHAIFEGLPATKQQQTAVECQQAALTMQKVMTWASDGASVSVHRQETSL